MRKILFAVAAVLPMMASAQVLVAGKVVGSKHDMTAANTGISGQAASVSACDFCHAPHHAMPGSTILWARQTSTAVYTDTTVAVHEDSTRCLSCHDGTIAANTTYKFASGGSTITEGAQTWGKSDRSHVVL